MSTAPLPSLPCPHPPLILLPAPERTVVKDDKAGDMTLLAATPEVEKGNESVAVGNLSSIVSMPQLCNVAQPSAGCFGGVVHVANHVGPNSSREVAVLRIMLDSAPPDAKIKDLLAGD